MIEKVMTYDEWEREYSRKKKIKANRLIYYLKQKLVGTMMLVISIVTPILTGDATISLIMLPLGLYLIFTKDKCLLEKKEVRYNDNRL